MNTLKDFFSILYIKRKTFEWLAFKTFRPLLKRGGGGSMDPPENDTDTDLTLDISCLMNTDDRAHCSRIPTIFSPTLNGKVIFFICMFIAPFIPCLPCQSVHT